MSSMSGWLIEPFKLNRPVSHAEMSANLRADGLPSVDPLNKGAIHLDATCLEYHDRYFLFRGWGVLGGGFFALFAMALAAAVSYGFLQSSKGQVGPVFWGIAIMVLMCGLPALYALKALFFKDAFRYTHYPIRFNRDNRMVYVFTGGARQILKVPFDDAFFFINEDTGAGASAVRLYDLRMHVLQDEKIIHTVSIGSDSGGSAGIILAHWEMIRRFMDQGLDALPFPPLGIFASSHVSVKNSFIIPFAVFNGPLRWILSPFLIFIGVTKYIALVTSKRPVWPKVVDAECRPASGGRVFRQPPMYGDLPDGQAGESAFMGYWKKAEARARLVDKELASMFPPAACL